jgi:hypothetical protein
MRGPKAAAPLALSVSDFALHGDRVKCGDSVRREGLYLAGVPNGNSQLVTSVLQSDCQCDRRARQSRPIRSHFPAQTTGDDLPATVPFFEVMAGTSACEVEVHNQSTKSVAGDAGAAD